MCNVNIGNSCYVFLAFSPPVKEICSNSVPYKYLYYYYYYLYYYSCILHNDEAKYYNVLTFFNILFLTKHDYVTFSSLLSQIRLSSVTFVHPTQGVETFGNISSPFCTLAIL